MATKQRLIAIVGPTASGKTALAIEVAKKYDGEIICADSRTVYKDLDIGTAKPTAAEQKAIRHYGLDLVNPNESFSAADFQRLAKNWLEDIWARGRLPVVVGGTGLYIDGLLYNYDFGPPVDLALRMELEKKSIEELQNLCKKSNIELPENKKNKRYLIRAIEQSGVNHKRNKELFYNALVIGLNPNKSVLIDRITKRTDTIFNKNVDKEATTVAKKYGWDAPGLTGNVYQVVRQMLAGKLNKEQALEKSTTADWRLAKRQLTWFKRNSDIQWSNDFTTALQAVDKFITKH